MSRVWAYIISKELSKEDLDSLQQSGNQFVIGWTAHENKLSAEFSILFNRIILVKVNENVHEASGCSIDKLTRFIKETEQKFNIELLNRLLVAYKIGETVEVAHASKIKELLAQNSISENTLILNTALANENDLKNWEQELKNTWLSKYLVKA